MPNSIKTCDNPDCTRRVYRPDRDYCAKCWIKLTDEGRAYNAKRQRDHVAKTKAHFAAVAAMKAAPLLLICAGAALSDPLPRGATPQRVFTNEQNGGPQRVTATDPLGYRPTMFPRIPGGVSSERIFDRPVTGSEPIVGPTLLASWRGAPEGTMIPGLYGAGLGSRAGGSSPVDTNGDGRGASCERGNASFCPRPRPTDPAVPGPLPVLALAAAWGWARRLRRRVG